jgi:drug/metabolite transporter (DMT)-like permease
VNNDRRALAFGLGAIFLWSTVGTAFKIALVELSVLQLLMVAVCTSTVALVGVVSWQGRLHVLLATLASRPLALLGMGCISPLLYYSILLSAYDYLPAQQAQTINYTWAITLVLLSIPVLGQRLNARDWLAVALGYVGVVIIATEGDPLSLQFTSGIGVALALGSTFIWAGFWLLNARAKGNADILLAAYFLCAAPLSVVMALLFGGGLPSLGVGLASAVYVGFFEMGFTWLLWSSALRLARNVSRVGNLIFLAPLLSLVFIALILDERIHPATLLGLALIVPGILLQQRAALAEDTGAEPQ